jgi:hypothetical protein
MISAAAQRFALPAQGREVGSGSRAVLKEPRFTNPEIHNAAFVHQVVIDALDKAGVRLRMGIGILRFGQFAGFAST